MIVSTLRVSAEFFYSAAVAVDCKKLPASGLEALERVQARLPFAKNWHILIPVHKIPSRLPNPPKLPKPPSPPGGSPLPNPCSVATVNSFLGSIQAVSIWGGMHRWCVENLNNHCIALCIRRQKLHLARLGCSHEFTDLSLNHRPSLHPLPPPLTLTPPSLLPLPRK